MSKKRVPDSVRQFVEQQKTVPVADVWDGNGDKHESPYGSYWYRAVACILLSGRIQAKADGAPNMTDVNRLGKEANFNQYLTERVGKFLVAMAVILSNRHDKYEAGPNLSAFWKHDVDLLPAITREAVLRLVRYHGSHSFWLPKSGDDSHLIEFLSLFFASFRGRALVESEVGQIFHDFALLPEDDLLQAANGFGLAMKGVNIGMWNRKLDAKGQAALVAALYTAEWAYCVEHKKTVWLFPSPTGLAMLGLGPLPAAPKLAAELKTQSDLSVRAGMGLAWEKLVPLFRYCTIKRINEVCEFKLDRKKLAESPANNAPAAELREALSTFEPLPSTVEAVLGTKSKVGGKVGIRWCSALVKPESSEALDAIRHHHKLKGYLEPGAPPGYLLLKATSRPDNFVQRCRELGFDVTPL